MSLLDRARHRISDWLRPKAERSPALQFDFSEFQSAVQKEVRARLDAAQVTPENRNHWKNSDNLSARSAYSPYDRATIRYRSRYEAENNSYYSGLLRTAASHIAGRGPRLQVLTADLVANRRLEKAWRKWSKKNRLAEELRVAVETYWRDGEIFFLRRYQRHTTAGQVGLKICSYEADQCTNAYGAPSDPNHEDGVEIDALGEPVRFYFLDHHPGDLNVPRANLLTGKWYPAADVVHLYRKERPGQLRGMARLTPALELFPKLRRHTLATLAAAEAVANWTLFIKTTAGSVAPAIMPREFMSVGFSRAMLNFLPDGWEPFQIKPEQPTTNHEMFQRQTLTEIARCTSLPYLLVAGTSKDSNYSSAQMDIKAMWGPEVVQEQDRITDLVVERFWEWFLEDAVMVPGLLDGLPPNDEIDHQWLWDPLPTTDRLDEAQANDQMLKSGQMFIAEAYARSGRDFESDVRKAADDYKLPEDTIRRAVFYSHFPLAAETAAGAPGTATMPGAPAQPATLSSLGRRQFSNNVKATRDILQEFIEGKSSEAQARLLLQGLGWNPDAATEFLRDARDGSIDDPQLKPQPAASSTPATEMAV